MTASAPKRPGPGPSASLGLATVSIASTVLAVDLWTKQIFYPGDGFDVIPPVFSITPRANTGGVFGLLTNWPVANAAFLLVSCGAIAFLGWLYVREAGRLGFLFAAATGLVLGGALGNLVDRALYGFVRDFLDFHVGEHAWPTFNVADAAICVGTAGLGWTLWRASAEEVP